MEEKRNKPPVMVILSFAVLRYQKGHLKELSVITGKPQSELAREALSLLFSQYQKMGY